MTPYPAERFLSSPTSPSNPTAPSELRAIVEELLERVVRPLVVADGGEIELVSLLRDRVVLRLSGSCSGCPGRPYTISRLVEPALRRALGPNCEISVELG